MYALTNRNTNVTRSNARGMMIRLGRNYYAVFDVRDQFFVYSGNGDQTRSFWNRNYRQYHQFATPNGVRHDYLFA